MVVMDFLRRCLSELPIRSNTKSNHTGMKTKSEYKLALQIVRTIIHEWDPYSLLAGGAPDDEFDREIASVASQVTRIKSQADAAHVISRVFSSAFEHEGFSAKDCAEVGAKLFDALSRNGLLPI